MCGIYGVLRLKDAREISEGTLEAMGRVIRHRGPDDHGHYRNKGIGLGMRRLSIIDLAGGHQPISNEDQTIWVVCNGEIYNFKELRAELEKNGHHFGCNSDTEVLVHLYEQEGLDFLKRLRGMFALAIWDEPRSRLILARDRLGKKPLYVCRETDRLLFASEMKSLLEVSAGSRTLNPVALAEYLALGYVPAPGTLLEQIVKLLPGHCMVVEKGHVKDFEYWDIPCEPLEDWDEAEWIERIREKLLEAVRVRMVSDVPLGAFLSGGIDSSSIVAAMASMTDRPVKTYSIGFEGRDRFYNELPYARVVAKAFRTEHHEIIVRPQVSQLLPKLIWHLDEPIADSAFVTTYLVAKLAGESVKVILSGVGGDELFGGYRRYLGNRLAGYCGFLPGIVRRRWLPGLVGALPQDRNSPLKNYTRYADAFLKSSDMDYASRYVSYITLFSPDLQQTLLRTPSIASGSALKKIEDCIASRPDMTPLNRLMYADLKTSLTDDLLALTDKMTMAASLECRAPFIDQELIELAARMPDSLKVRGFKMKYLLKKVVKPWLPAEILNRKKRGFGAPVGSWMRHDLSAVMDALLSEEQVRKRGLFNWPVIDQMIARHNAQQQDYTDQLLALVSLELWCRIFLDGVSHEDVATLMEGATTRVVA